MPAPYFFSGGPATYDGEAHLDPFALFRVRVGNFGVVVVIVAHMMARSMRNHAVGGPKSPLHRSKAWGTCIFNAPNTHFGAGNHHGEKSTEPPKHSTNPGPFPLPVSHVDAGQDNLRHL